MKFILSALITLALWLPVDLFAQKMSEPTWEGVSTDPTVIEFRTAKISLYNEKTKKYGDDTYKDCKITLNLYNGKVDKVTIDVPDKFYMLDGQVTSMEFEQKSIELESMKYIVEIGNKYASILFVWKLLSKDPDYILITYSDNILKKPLTLGTVLLSELKK